MSDITIDYDSINEAFKEVQKAHDEYFNGKIPSEVLSLDLFITLIKKENINIPEILTSFAYASFVAGCLFGAQKELIDGNDSLNLFKKVPDPHNSK